MDVMKMKVYSYSNPKKINDETYYKDFKYSINLCASETLRLGLTNKNKRKDYGYIFSIDTLIQQVYSDWNNPVNQIKQINLLAKRINKIKDEKIRSSFNFNKLEVYKSIRMLIELGITPEEIESENILIKELKNIYFYLKKNSEDWKIKSKFISIENQEENQRKLKSILNELLKDDFKENRYSKDLISMIKRNINNLDITKVYIHGLHRFTPIILKLINDLKKIGIEVIFIINYMEEYPEIYRTWDKVYSTLGLSIHSEKSDVLKENLGKNIGELLNGEVFKFNSSNSYEFLEFDNLTEFADYVSNIYKQGELVSEEFGDSKSIINHMSEQFYSAEMDDINNILKQYHPKQFGEKHFLAYPVGQFIMSIYNMWDNDENNLLLDTNNLRQCLSLGFLNNNKYSAITIYNKVEPYFLNLKIKKQNNISSFIKHLNYLKHNLNRFKQLESNVGKQTLLRRFSFYYLEAEEIDYLIKTLKIIENIALEIFRDSKNNTKISFYNHYRKLLILLKAKIDEKNLLRQEKEMIEELETKLMMLKDVDIEGDILDIKESLHFYLNRVEDLEMNEKQASWIVRSLEHLDGGILLESRKNKKIYHLCLIGDIDMNKPINEIIPWPLTEKFFMDNNFAETNYKTVMLSYKERSNFLRYCLFYGTYFLESEIKISYIKNRKEKVDSPYYILKILGIDFNKYSQGAIIKNSIEKVNEYNLDYRFSVKTPINIDHTRNYLYCEYKFLLEDVIEGNTVFYNPFLQELYYRTLLFINCVNKINKMRIDDFKLEKNIKLIINEENKILRKNNFNLWKEYIFIDAEDNVFNQFKEIGFNRIKEIDKNYLEIRKKFIYAKINDENSSDNLIIDLHSNFKNNKVKKEMINKFIKNDSLKVSVTKEKCEKCGLSEICLERYSE